MDKEKQTRSSTGEVASWGHIVSSGFATAGRRACKRALQKTIQDFTPIHDIQHVFAVNFFLELD